MRKPLPYRQILFLLTPALLFSCGGGQAGRTPASTFSTTAQLVATRDLTTEERAIATRICYAYQSKGTNFRTPTYLGGTFNYSVSSTDCSKSKKSYQVKAILETSGQSLAMKPQEDVAFESAVQTNESGLIKQLCTKIQNNQAISNTADSGTEKVQISFFKDTLDAYNIQYFSNEKGKFVASGAEVFKVRTQFNLTNASQILGMDEVYMGYETCSGETYAEFYQNFTGWKMK